MSLWLFIAGKALALTLLGLLVIGIVANCSLTDPAAVFVLLMALASFAWVFEVGRYP